MDNSDTAAGGGREEEQTLAASELYGNFMGNVTLIRSVLGRFIERTERQFTEIPVLIEKGDWEAAIREIHTLKGSARTLGGRDLGNAAMDWEEACKKKDAAAIPPGAVHAGEAFARFKTAAEKLLATEEKFRLPPEAG
jgi:HPt (histidine-containing phosphotransfer) domain-containing protein